ACVGAVCSGAVRQEGVLRPVEPPMGRLGLMVRALTDGLEPRRRTVVLGATEAVVQGAAVDLGEHVVELSPLERGVLGLLVERPGAVVSRPQLLQEVWGTASTEPHLLESTVTRLRRRLGPCGSALRSVPGRGYRLDTAAAVPAASSPSLDGPA
ncbi:MAG TPA: winged helix-turn-helix domain-containing protein, partial [Acidimicrobiales bacterium]|nr:winged helix-turn-helix domain-containing protein [Acidimicrobiales bacterium]